MDRALSIVDWNLMYPEVFMHRLPWVYSNHHPFLLYLNGNFSIPNAKPFKFKAIWPCHPEYEQIVSKAISDCNGPINSMLTNIQIVSYEFNQKNFGEYLQKEAASASKNQWCPSSAFQKILLIPG